MISLDDRYQSAGRSAIGCFRVANTAEDTVVRLNALFEIVVPAVVDAGGHVNRFLGDGALAVFGAPNDLADHADAPGDSASKVYYGAHLTPASLRRLGAN